MRLFFIILASVSFLMTQSCKYQSGSQPIGSEQSAAADTAVITFSEYEHDFGKIVEGEKVAVIFTFQNTGKGPLTINSVTTTCGCTASKYSRKPVAPGESGTIEIVFDSGGYNGAQRKTITVRSNASTPHIILQVKAEVISRT